MNSRKSRFPAAAKRPSSAPAGYSPRTLLVGALIATVVFFQPSAHATPNAASAEEVAVTQPAVSAARIAELEKGFWICDYLGTTRGTEGPHGVTCGANFEEIKQAKFGGDFEQLVAWWRLHKAAQHKALESTSSAQF